MAPEAAPAALFCLLLADLLLGGPLARLPWDYYCSGLLSLKCFCLERATSELFDLKLFLQLDFLGATLADRGYNSSYLLEGSAHRVLRGKLFSWKLFGVV